MTMSDVLREPAAAGDEERRVTFEREALVHLDCLFRVALRIVGNADDAEDLVQDTVLHAYRMWDRYQRDTNARGWLITIMRHLFTNAYRRDTERREILTRHFAADSGERRTHGFDDLLDDEVARAIDTLPPPYRAVFTLRDVEDLRYEEIAKLLDLPVGTVKSRLFRARSLLQERLRDYAASLGIIARRQNQQERAGPEQRGSNQQDVA